MSGSEDKSRRPRLLVVDDSRLILEMVYDFFTPHGWIVDAAPSAEKALDLLEANPPPDVIVTDILMPRMDGWEFFDELHGRPRFSGIPVVFLSTETDLAKRLRGFDMGGDDYLTKPFDVEELHARVGRLVEQREALDRARATGDDALISGSVKHLSLADLLQILALNSKDGVVELREGEREGRIVFENGSLVHAECGAVRGEKALYRMLGWSTATFRLVSRRGEAPERTVLVPTSSVLMDGLVSLDEWNRWRPILPPVEYRVDVDPDVESRPHAEDATRAEMDVMRRAKGGMSVGEILDESPLPDAELAEALCTLLTREVIRTRE